MALGDFFRINMPFGIKRNANGSWFVFNREYMPLGFGDYSKKGNIGDELPYKELPVNNKYQGFTVELISKLVEMDIDLVQIDQEGSPNRIFLYDDSTNPQSFPDNWNIYWKKIELLSTLTTPSKYD